jgi:hypothetical protein
MRTTASFAAALAIAALTCAQAAAQRVDSALVGSWSGQASIAVPWTVQRTLSMRLDITEDGSVTGAIGDARLLDGRVAPGNVVARAMHLERRFAIDGRLSGALIRAEGIQRDRVHVSFDRAGPTLVGDLQTSGTYEGGPADLVLTAKQFELQRVAPAVVHAPQPPLGRPEDVAARVLTPR